jgi:cytidine deaminase
VDHSGVDWVALRAAAIGAMSHAYAPYSRFPVGAAGLVDDGRVVVGCNVENASYGLTLCAECGMVSSLQVTGGGQLVAVSCVDGTGAALMPCGRCRQLIWEHGGPECLVDHPDGPLRMADLLPHAFGPEDLDRVAGAESLPARLREFQGRGAVFVHADSAGGERVWTAYWERSDGFTDDSTQERGILEEGPLWPDARAAIAWGRSRTPRVVVVDTDGQLYWAGTAAAPPEVPHAWRGHD